MEVLNSLAARCSEPRRPDDNREDLERLVTEREAALASLRAHADNLEAEREHDQQQMLELSKHATNLEKALCEHQVGTASLEAHVKRLEEHHHSTLEGFVAHADNLESILSGVREHAANLEDERQRQGAQIENLEQLLRDRREHIRNLESLRAKLDQRDSRRNAEAFRLRVLSTSRLRESERLARRLRHLTSSFWVRLLCRLRLVRSLSAQEDEEQQDVR